MSYSIGVQQSKPATLLSILFVLIFVATQTNATVRWVTNLYYSGSGSLLEAIGLAVDGDTIRFEHSLTGSINPFRGGSIATRLVIEAEGPGRIVLVGVISQIPMLIISSTGNVSISGVRMTDGYYSIVNYGQVTLKDCLLDHSRAAIKNYGQLLIDRCTIWANQVPADSAMGSGLLNRGAALLVNSTFCSNAAGGEYYDPPGPPPGSTLRGVGGAIWNSGILRIVGCTIASNRAYGGFYVGNGTTGYSGGGIYNYAGGEIRMKGSIVANNISDPIDGRDVEGSFISEGHNFIGKSDGSTGFVHGINGDLVGTNASPINPLLDTLFQNGGFTSTLALRSGSPAINAGVIDSFLITDQRGFSRDTIPDMGSYEYGAVVSVGNGLLLVPEGYTLEQNFPNPFNPSTIIRFFLPRSGTVKLRVLNILGQEVAELVSTQYEPGLHSIVWDSKANVSGVYFYQLVVNDYVAIRKMLLVK